MRLGAFRNNGQVCSLKTRVLVSEARVGEFVERLDAQVDSMPLGDPQNDATQIGPEGLDSYTELRSIGLPPEFAATLT